MVRKMNRIERREAKGVYVRNGVPYRVEYNRSTGLYYLVDANTGRAVYTTSHPAELVDIRS